MASQLSSSTPLASKVRQSLSPNTKRVSFFNKKPNGTNDTQKGINSAENSQPDKRVQKTSEKSKVFLKNNTLKLEKEEKVAELKMINEVALISPRTGEKRNIKELSNINKQNLSKSNVSIGDTNRSRSKVVVSRLKENERSLNAKKTDKKFDPPLDYPVIGSKSYHGVENAVTPTVSNPLNIYRTYVDGKSCANTKTPAEKLLSPRRERNDPKPCDKAKPEAPINRTESCKKIQSVDEQEGQCQQNRHRKTTSSIVQNPSRFRLQSPTNHVGSRKGSFSGMGGVSEVDAYKRVPVDIDKESDCIPSVTDTECSQKPDKDLFDLKDMKNMAISIHEDKITKSEIVLVSPKKNDEPGTSTKKNLNLVIPSIHIDKMDQIETQKDSKKAVVYTFQNLTPSKDISINYSDNDIKPEDKPEESHKEDSKGGQIQGSRFSFPMHYFKPIEDSTLDKFIQSVNDSQGLIKTGLEKSDIHSKSSHNLAFSGSNNEKTMSYLTKSSFATLPTSRANASPTGMTERGKVTKTLCSPRGVKADQRKSVLVVESGLEKTKKNNERHSVHVPPVVDTKFRSKSPPTTFNYMLSKSYRPANGEVEKANQTKTWKEASNSSKISPRQTISTLKLPERRDLAFDGSYAKNSTRDSDDKFSNLDKLLAQLRNNPASRKDSVPFETDRSLEGGLFNQNREEAGEVLDMDCILNKSLAKNLMKLT